MEYRIVDNAPNHLLRGRCYTNKGHALFYAKALKRTLPLGYKIYVDSFVLQGVGCNEGYTRIAEFNSIGNHKNVKITTKK